MNTTKRDQKEQELSKKKTLSPESIFGREYRSKTSPAEYWQKAINCLKGKEFADLTAAINAVVEEAVSHVAPDIKENRQMKEFLFTCLDTDPGLKQELGKSLQIKEPGRQ